MDLKHSRKGARSSFTVCAAFACWMIVIVLLILNRDSITVESILIYTPENRFFAALVLLLLFALKSLSVVLFSGILYAAAGILFPIPVAILVNLLGAAVMVTIPYWFGRWEDGNMVARIISQYPRASQFQRLRKQNDLFFAFLLRFLGILPADIVSAYLGSTGTPYWKYLGGSLLGILPEIITFPIMGSSITDVRSPQFIFAVCTKLGVMICSFVYYRKIKKEVYYE